MNRKFTKAMVCAVAAAVMLSNSSYQTDAAVKVSAFLPAAGIGLMMGEGTSVAKIREDVRQKAENKSAEQSTAQVQENNTAKAQPAETQNISQTPAAAANIAAAVTQILETAPAAESQTVQPESASGEMQNKTAAEPASIQETAAVPAAQLEIVEAIEPQLKTVPSDNTAEAESKEAASEEEPISKEESVSEEESMSEEANETLENEESTDAEAAEADAEAPAQEQEVLIIAQVNDYVNIRSIPSTDGEIVGKLYDDSVGTLISEENGWYLMKSGSVEGYVKAEYFKIGEEAKRIADEVGNKIATVTTETLRVRTDASLEASVLGLVPGGEVLTVLAQENGFVKVSIEEGDGWVSMDYVDVEVEYVTAESIAEERARLAKEEQAKEDARKAAEAAEAKLREEAQRKEAERLAQEAALQAAAAANAEAANTAAVQTAPAAQETAPAAETAPAPVQTTSLGQAVANFAVQFVGNPYVYGGTSLTNGADCSGFVMSVYKNFGVSLPHSSSADRKVGYAVDGLANAQPGDIVCYSGHVGIYIGNGQIVHASTEKTGIKISNASYRKVLAVRRIF